MRAKMNRLKCFLSGGHRYSDANLISYKDERKGAYVFCNFCVKCGKPYLVFVDAKRLLESYYGESEEI